MNPKPRTRRPRLWRFSLATLLVLLTAFGLWLGRIADRVHRQRAAVEAIRRVGGVAFYDWQFDAEGKMLRDPQPPGPAWLREFLGDDFLANVEVVGLLNVGLGESEPPPVDFGDEDVHHLANLPHLRHLQLSGSRVTDDGLTSLGGLTRLEHLDFGGAPITGRGFAHLRRLKQLRKLWLCGSPIRDEHLTHLAASPELETLNLRETQVSDAGMVHIAKLEELRDLDLANTRLTDAGMIHVAKLPRLQLLCLAGTQITDASAPLFGSLEELTSIDVGGTCVGDETAARLARLPKIAGVYMTNTAITDAGLSPFHANDPSRDYEFWLEGTNISDEAVASLQLKLPKARISYDPRSIDRAGNTRINDAAFRRIADRYRHLPPYYRDRIQQIDLSHTGITDESLRLLDDFPNLERITVTGSQVTEVAIEAFRKTRPQVEVIQKTAPVEVE
jgi:Leucine-rich repeat (LRR) protein